MAFAKTPLLAALLALAFGAAGWAQQGNIDFGGLRADPKQPVEVSADSFSIDQASNSATFSGDVRISQGDMVITAGAVSIEYAEDGKGIKKLVASGGVILKAGADAAQAETATYIIDTAEITLSGGVILTQGSAAISGQTLLVNLTDGTGKIEGRVTTTFVPGGN